ncbi:MAG: two-component regulator propeller domain-containing protein, partial [Bacteroidota bacterium]
FSFQYSQSSKFIFEDLPVEVRGFDWEINSMLQDFQGFIWMASWKGLWKFDGYNNENLCQDLSFSNGLKSDQLICLFEDDKNRLWVGSNYSGFYLYDREKNSFIQFQKDLQADLSLRSNNVLSIGADRDQLLWIGTDEGLSCFDPDKREYLAFEAPFQDNESKTQRFFSSAQSEEGLFWVGGEQGLGRLVKGKKGKLDSFTFYNMAPIDISSSSPEYLRHNFIYKIVPSKLFPHTLWVSTKMGLKKVTYNPHNVSQFQLESFDTQKEKNMRLSHNSVSDIVEDTQTKRLWIATFNGLNLLDLEENKVLHFFHDEISGNSIKNNVVNSLFLDNNKFLWINTDGGTNRINFAKEAVGRIQIKEGKKQVSFTTSFAPAYKRDGYWVGTNGTGLCFIQADKGVPNRQPCSCYSMKTKLAEDLSGFVSDIIVSKQGDIWMSTEGAGIIRIKESSIPPKDTLLIDLEQYTKNSHEVNDYVMALYESVDGGIWFGYWDKGIGRYDPQTNSFVHYDLPKELNKYPIYCLNETLEEGEHFLWIGTGGGGLLKLKWENKNDSLHLVKHFDFNEHEEGGKQNFINSIYRPIREIASRKLYIGTEGGLALIDLWKDSVVFLNIGIRYGQPSTSTRPIRSIIQDKEDYIWFASNGEFCQVLFDTSTSQVRSFSVNNSLVGDASLLLESGELIFGNVEGLYYFSPNDLSQSVPLRPEVALVDFRLFNQSVPVGKSYDGSVVLPKHINETDTISLAYKNDVISFEFIALQTNTPQNVRFA